MKNFTATCKYSGRNVVVTAETIEDAAGMAATELNKTKKRLAARRQTGTSGMSGCFQAYTHGNPQIAVGYLFHVTEA